MQPLHMESRDPVTQITKNSEVLLIYLFTCLFPDLIIIVVSILLSLFRIKFSLFFMHDYMKSSQIQTFSGDQLKRPQKKQVLKPHALCSYESKIRMKLSSIKMLFSNHTFLFRQQELSGTALQS